MQYLALFRDKIFQMGLNKKNYSEQCVWHYSFGHKAELEGCEEGSIP